MRDSIQDFTGDRPGAEQMRRNLRVLREHFTGTPLGDQIGAVLAGRMSMRELAGDPEFATMAHEGMRTFAEEWAAMSPEQRAELTRQGEARQAELLAELDDEGR